MSNATKQQTQNHEKQTQGTPQGTRKGKPVTAETVDRLEREVRRRRANVDRSVN